MRGLSALMVCNDNNLKIVAISNCLSRSGRPLPHSHYFTVEDEFGRLWKVLESYGSFVGAINYWTNEIHPVNDENLWSTTTKRAFGLKIETVREKGRTIEEIIKILTNA